MEGDSVPTRWLRVDTVLFCLVVLIYGFFHGGGWHNQNSRFDAMVAFAEPDTPDFGTFRIDRFMRDGSGGLINPSRRGGNTMAWSWYPPVGRAYPDLAAGETQGHYYSYKAPGTIVLAFGVWAISSQPRRIGWYLLGGALPLVMFGVYHWMCFGSAFAVATNFTQDEFLSEGDFLGLFGSLSIGHLLALLTSRYRGILLHMPILLLSVVGLVSWLRRRPADRLAWLCLVTIGGLLALNASFNSWHGGPVVSARYQILALPFWVLCLKELPWRGMWRPVAAVLVGVSAFNILAVAAVSPTSLPWSPDWSNPANSPQYINPFWTPGEPIEHVADAAPSPQHPLFYDSLYGYTYLQFWSGKLAAREIRKLMFLRIDDAPMWRPTNAGMLIGLRGLPSLVPLVLLAGLGF